MTKTLFYIIFFLLTSASVFANDEGIPITPELPILIEDGGSGNGDGSSSFPFISHSREQLEINRISLPFYYRARAGATLPINIRIKNKDDFSIDNGLSVTFSIPQLGLKRKTGPDTILAKAEATKKLGLTLPSNARPGIYLGRLTVSSDKFHRTVYRLIKITQK